ncbi:hypothetical protein [Variovorax sp. R-27]|uniref:hypothetical protein n=1 Tax=Variovorax sp. R-27 TaxID=3404058 RepID=UPI003CF8E348
MDASPRKKPDDAFRSAPVADEFTLKVPAGAEDQFMDSRFEVSDAVRNLDPDRIDSDRFSWRAALLGAAVGVGGQTYGSTLLANVSTLVLQSLGASPKEAYAQVYGFALTPSLVLSFALGVCVYLACGYVAASHARSRPCRHGLAAGLMTASFFVLMVIGPYGSSIPGWYAWLALTLPVACGTAGAYLYARKRGGGVKP